MFLPELNHISNYRYELGGFGGINRRETADAGEFSEAVNLSSREFPLIIPRKRYDVGLYRKTALMWHNNDRDMALVPALKAEDFIIISNQDELTLYGMTLGADTHGVIWQGEGDGKLECLPSGADGKKETATLKPGCAYLINKTGYSDALACMIGTIEAVSGKSLIVYEGKSIEIPTVVAFKNPVCANIGTSTVICDEFNGMWVLEYDKDTDSYTYNKVQQRYEVKNETKNDLEVPDVEGTTVYWSLVKGGDICHVRLHYDDTYRPTGIDYAIDANELKDIAIDKNKPGYLVRMGTDEEAQWFRIFGKGLYEPIDRIRTRLCIKNADKLFKVGDYVEIKNLKIHFEYANAIENSPYRDWNEKESQMLGYINGQHEIVNIVKNDDGVGWAIDIETDIPHQNAITTMFAERTQHYEEGKGDRGAVTETNDVYLADGFVIERKAPENVRFICAHMNRIWANNGDNEIMCCAPGNPYTWYRYEGNSLDSWAATVGGDGAFTGCINYGYPLFFKENKMLRVTGTRPSNFGYDEYSIKGIKDGCHESAVIVDDVLYYQSIDGIYTYNSATPVRISDKVWNSTWQKGRACRHRDLYYIAVNEHEQDHLYCYDTSKGVWHREYINGGNIIRLYPGRFMDEHEKYMTVYTEYTDNEDYITTGVGYDLKNEDLSAASYEHIRGNYYAGYTLGMGNEYIRNREEQVEWSFETTDLLASEIETKYLKGIYVNCRIASNPDDEIELSVMHNDDDRWTHIGIIGPQKGSGRSVWSYFPLREKNCDNLKIKAQGKGEAVIYSIILDFEKGAKQ